MGSRSTSGGPRQRLLLAVLLDRRNTVVPRSRLIAALWDDEPPDSAEAALHNAVSQLRRSLEPRRASGEPPRVLETHAGGYLLRAGGDAVDIDLVVRLRSEAARAADDGELAAAAAALERALGLWRGESLGDLTRAGRAGHRRRAGRASHRRRRRTSRSSYWRSAGRATSPSGSTPLVQAYPLRARLRGQLMLALYRAGRPQEALARVPGRLPGVRGARARAGRRAPAAGTGDHRAGSGARRVRPRLRAYWFHAGVAGCSWGAPWPPWWSPASRCSRCRADTTPEAAATASQDRVLGIDVGDRQGRRRPCRRAHADQRRRRRRAPSGC